MTWSKQSPLFFAAALIVAAMGVGAAVGFALSGTSETSTLFLGTLIVGGLLLLLLALGGLAMALAMVGEDQRKHALALPQGSIRAILAIGLLVTFAVFALHLDSKAEESELAKQIFATVSTALVAVVGFYFGSRTSTNATQAATQRDGEEMTPLKFAKVEATRTALALKEARENLATARDDLNAKTAAAVIAEKNANDMVGTPQEQNSKDRLARAETELAQALRSAQEAKTNLDLIEIAAKAAEVKLVEQEALSESGTGPIERARAS